MTRILIVEDEVSFSDPLSYLLSKEGYEVSVAENGHDALTAFDTTGADLVLLDLMLPGLSGVDVCRALRQRSNVPVIMLTAKDSEIDKVVGLELGADDYVTKPYSPRELAARIQAMRRRPRTGKPGGESASAVREYGALRIDPDVREVTLDGRVLDLTKIEFGIIDLLSSAPRRTFTRGQLLEDVWGDNWYGGDHIIDVHVGNLRKKLGESASSPRYIKTLRGVGYRFEP